MWKEERRVMILGVGMLSQAADSPGLLDCKDMIERDTLFLLSCIQEFFSSTIRHKANVRVTLFAHQEE